MPMNCVNNRLSPTVARLDQMKMGMRKKLIPGARSLSVVVRMLIAVRIEESPAR